MKTYDLDDVMVTERIRDTWLAYAETAIEQLREKLPDLKSSDITDEQLRVGNGRAELFVTIKGYVVKMAVPKDEYEIKK